MIEIDQAKEAQFALRLRHPERDRIYARHAEQCAAFRATATAQLELRYAAGPRCTLDIFPAEADDAPVLFFIHGGYWRALNKELVSFIAKPFQAAGITVVMPGYDLVPNVRVGEIVDEIRAAYGWMLDRLAPARVVVSGHSAGAQLATMLTLDQIERGEGPIIGLAGLSGVYDLRPLLHTSINADLDLSPDAAREASPLLRLDAMQLAGALPPLVGAVGSEETAGFKDWTRRLCASWRDKCGEAALIEAEGATHFTILDQMADPGSALFGAVLALISGVDTGTMKPPSNLATRKGNAAC